MGMLSKLVTLIAVAGGAAAAASYYKQYQEFHKDLDEEFHDFEDEAETGAEEPVGEEAESVEESAPERSYTSLNAKKKNLPKLPGTRWRQQKAWAGPPGKC